MHEEVILYKLDNFLSYFQSFSRMSDSEEISNSSSHTSSSEHDSSFEDEIDVEKGGFYGWEPEHSEKELIDTISSQEDNADTLTSSSEDETESSRLENLHWCRCKNCVIGLDFVCKATVN